MELKEIFRHKEGKLYPTLQTTHNRYKKLEDAFLRFIGFFPPDEKGAFPEDVNSSFQVDKETPKLSVCYCGVEYDFLFDMVGDQGQVRCMTLTINAHEDDEPEELGRFEFNAKGVTNIKPPDDDPDQIEIVEGGGAYYVVANFLLGPFK